MKTHVGAIGHNTILFIPRKHFLGGSFKLIISVLLLRHCRDIATNVLLIY
jgi:hypothetical protein